MTSSAVFLGHSTVLLALGGVRVLTDPVLRSRLLFLRRTAAAVAPDHYAAVDAVVLSHLHHDHCDLPSLALLGRDVQLIAPEGAEDFLRRRGFARVVTLRAGRSHTVGQVTVTATPALHDGRREPFGPRAAAVGYLIESGQAAVYFAGDTDLFGAMADLCPELDLALLPVWGWGPNLGPGHLDPERAAAAVALLRPRFTVPVHWGTLFPYGLKPFFGGRLRTPPRAFADAVAARGTPTEVRLLAPGRGMTW
ncbi:MBL fold metallo-hydrolase [Catellatospora sp. KI3]|uniref:MBL fold metallo-hydrolase n=1 Tax=Catellatospora sp. KI3 TaxID=3041620 RepID=UPI0024822982|nr:MBL fold metallo-hydrolase [Catellatospora sp. KI3]MDI1460919.1 MBL fold metallo-hydrolase [Catellatospora sp. KI3]